MKASGLTHRWSRRRAVLRLSSNMYKTLAMQALHTLARRSSSHSR